MTSSQVFSFPGTDRDDLSSDPVPAPSFRVEVSDIKGGLLGLLTGRGSKGVQVHVDAPQNGAGPAFSINMPAEGARALFGGAYGVSVTGAPLAAKGRVWIARTKSADDLLVLSVQNMWLGEIGNRLLTFDLSDHGHVAPDLDLLRAALAED